MRKSLFAFLFIFSVYSFATAQTKLLRFPDFYEGTVVFCYAGNIWKASAEDGTAVRLTAHPGQEIFPKFSPDGKWIAFTGQYDGDEQVYIMPSEGGVPKQLTYYPAHGPLAPRWGYDNQIYGWSPDGKQVLFRSLRDANGGSTVSALYTVDVTGGLPAKLPMPTSGAGDFSPDGKKLVYSPLFRDFRTWKRYQGGWAQDLYIFDLQTYDAQKIAASVRSERDPMWIGNKIYFASDRDGTINLYVYDIAANAVSELTHSTTWDVRWPSSDNQGKVVYELDGELHVFDVNSEQDIKLSIFVPDDGLAMRPSHYSAEKNIEVFELSPKGERALFVARGDVFTAPIEKGATRNLTNSSNAHEREARWSPDGAKISFISDVSGEEQIYLVNQDGSGDPEQLTTQFKVRLNTPRWSPDGKRLAFSDKDGKVFVLTIATKAVQEVADDEFGGVSDYAWSAGSQYLAFSLANWSGYRSLYIWGISDGQLRQITSDNFNAYSPAWDPEGKYLFYLSDREFAPQISTIEWNFATNREVGIFAVALAKDLKNPFAPESDEVAVEKESTDKSEKKKSDKDDEKSSKEAPKDRIDFDGLAQRVVRVPVESDNFYALSATDGHLLYMQSGAQFYGRDSYQKPALQIFSMEKRKGSTLVEDVNGYVVSRDGKKVLVSENKKYNLYDAKPDAKEKKIVSTSDLMVDRIPAQEWETIFDEVWRRYRDFFYVRNMHGYDWEAIGKQYRELLPYVAHRSDLNYVLGEMVAELNVGHTYIVGGDFEISERPKVGLPGARFELDKQAGRYRIAKIFAGENEEDKYRSPLTEVGVDAKVGDYVLAIAGEELRGSDNPYRLLQHKADPVTLKLNHSPEMHGAREVTYKPLTSESNLLYKEWIDGNRGRVDEMSGGRVGYFHLPDMSSNGIYEFIKWYYPQVRKQGLVVDVRSNGGGNVSQWVIERLDNELLGTRFGFSSDKARTYPYTTFYGYMACIINQTSASDGDIFPHRFRKAGLGPLIGKRTWGGVVGGTYGSGPLLDGGSVFIPMQGTNDVDGSWIIEGEGVTPDIEVENDPKSVLAGEDPQLSRAVEEVLKQIEAHPKTLPVRPAAPVKTKKPISM